ncbi:hypothetical protein LK540_01550 [Massilia sp. IC2-278]|uniref:hypothetical protein n=1 Tax=Massilia sp. IC2-278 TaxID=2887200 RepID=UPI001E32C66A|nr:hypothetical protein [Massilia sp. IC2-278]MCC2959112.1 hypothetical protein [Massilia sp. IC2-278]
MRIGVPASSSVSWTPLVLTLGLHLLLVLAWLLRPGVQPVPQPSAERATLLVTVKPAAKPIHAAPRALREPVPKPARRPVARVLPASEPPAAVVADAESPQPEPVQAEVAAPIASVGELLARSRALAGRISRELPTGDSAMTSEPAGKWERFGTQVADARKTGSMAGTLDSHMAADGVIVYRKIVGSRVRCYRSGSVGGINPSDGQTAGNIPCPTGVRWTRL